MEKHANKSKSFHIRMWKLCEIHNIKLIKAPKVKCGNFAAVVLHTTPCCFTSLHFSCYAVLSWMISYSVEKSTIIHELHSRWVNEKKKNIVWKILLSKINILWGFCCWAFNHTCLVLHTWRWGEKMFLVTRLVSVVFLILAPWYCVSLIDDLRHINRSYLP